MVVRWTLSIALCAWAVSPAAAAEGRLFLFIGDEAPRPELVKAAFRELAATTPPLSPEVARARLGKVFPRLFAAGSGVDRGALESDLKAGRAAHFAGQYNDAEAALARALETAGAEPQWLEDKKLLQRFVDAAALRYKNTLARKRPKAEAKAQLEAFLVRYPLTSPTASEHAPEVIALWNEVRAGLKAKQGSLSVDVLPLELERSGACKLHLNGAEIADLPQPGPIAVPRGEHLVHVRCGPQVGWLERVGVGDAPVALRVPVRAMLSARGDAVTGGVILVAPTDGDALALVDAIADAAGLEGAVVTVASRDRVRFGRWDPGSDAPKLATVGRIEDDAIARVAPIGAGDEAGGGRVWTWVVGGVGLATLGAAVVLNVVTADKITSGEAHTEDWKTATIATYAVGGALVATGLLLFFVEGADVDGGEGASLVPAPGGLALRF